MGCTIVYSQNFIHSSKSKGTGFIMEEFIRATGTENSTANLKKKREFQQRAKYISDFKLFTWSEPVSLVFT